MPVTRVALLGKTHEQRQPDETGGPTDVGAAKTGRARSVSGARSGRAGGSLKTWGYGLRRGPGAWAANVRVVTVDGLRSLCRMCDAAILVEVQSGGACRNFSGSALAMALALFRVAGAAGPRPVATRAHGVWSVAAARHG
jgi:hypothetical protein